MQLQFGTDADIALIDTTLTGSNTKAGATGLESCLEAIQRWNMMEPKKMCLEDHVPL